MRGVRCRASTRVTNWVDVNTWLKTLGLLSSEKKGYVTKSWQYTRTGELQNCWYCLCYELSCYLCLGISMDITQGVSCCYAQGERVSEWYCMHWESHVRCMHGESHFRHAWREISRCMGFRCIASIASIASICTVSHSAVICTRIDSIQYI